MRYRLSDFGDVQRSKRQLMIACFSWNGVESVGDESPYVSAVRSHLRSSVPLIRDFFADRRKYFAHFCLKLATQLVNKFLGALFRYVLLS